MYVLILWDSCWCVVNTVYQIYPTMKKMSNVVWNESNIITNNYVEILCNLTYAIGRLLLAYSAFIFCNVYVLKHDSKKLAFCRIIYCMFYADSLNRGPHDHSYFRQPWVCVNYQRATFLRNPFTLSADVEIHLHCKRTFKFKAVLRVS